MTILVPKSLQVSTWGILGQNNTICVVTLEEKGIFTRRRKLKENPHNASIHELIPYSASFSLTKLAIPTIPSVNEGLGAIVRSLQIEHMVTSIQEDISTDLRETV